MVGWERMFVLPWKVEEVVSVWMRIPKHHHLFNHLVSNCWSFSETCRGLEVRTYKMKYVTGENSTWHLELFIVCSFPSACGSVCCLVPRWPPWRCKLQAFHKLPWLWHFNTAREKSLMKKVTGEKLGEGKDSTLYNTCFSPSNNHTHTTCVFNTNAMWVAVPMLCE